MRIITNVYSTTFTAMLWVKLMATGYYPRIFEFSNGVVVDSFMISFEDTANVRSSTSNSANSAWNLFAVSNTSLSLGVWAHVATTVDTNAHIIYVNGKQVGNAAGSTCRGGIIRNSCKIGRSDSYPTIPYLNAVLDEIKMFNRVLNQTEIFNEMQMTT